MSEEATEPLATALLEFLADPSDKARRARSDPSQRDAKVVGASVTWNYTTVRNILFLWLAGMLVCRYFRRGAASPSGPLPQLQLLTSC